jgi:hypothetical protein
VVWLALTGSGISKLPTLYKESQHGNDHEYRRGGPVRFQQGNRHSGFCAGSFAHNQPGNRHPASAARFRGGKLTQRNPALSL